MRYKNIIFDFGNVIGKFKGDYILGKFASTPEDYNILADAIFKNWVALDAELSTMTRMPKIRLQNFRTV